MGDNCNNSALSSSNSYDSDDDNVSSYGALECPTCECFSDPVLWEHLECQTCECFDGKNSDGHFELLSYIVFDANNGPDSEYLESVYNMLFNNDYGSTEHAPPPEFDLSTLKEKSDDADPHVSNDVLSDFHNALEEFGKCHTYENGLRKSVNPFDENCCSPSQVETMRWLWEGRVRQS